MDVLMLGLGWLMGLSMFFGAIGGWLLFLWLMVSSLALPQAWWEAGRRWRGPLGIKTTTAS